MLSHFPFFVLYKDLYRRPLLAHILMVHEFAETARNDTKKVISDLEHETNSDHVAADLIGEKVRIHLGLSWEDVFREVDEFKWESRKNPGPVVSLNKLKL
jgi:hypothetical protein